MGWNGQQAKLFALGILVIVGGGLWMDARRKVAWHSKGRSVVRREVGGGRGKGQGVWREKSGGRKQEEGEVATAPSPSYK